MGVSNFLESGPNDLISQKKKYRGVKSLYGCADVGPVRTRAVKNGGRYAQIALPR